MASVDRALRAALVPARGETLLLALSGGADSVALLDALALLRRPRGFRLVAAHLDHGLRRDSAEDAAFCRRLCADLEVDRLVLRPLNDSEGVELRWDRAGYRFEYQRALLPWRELVRASGRAAELCRRLEEQAIFVRDISVRFPGYVRITIGLEMGRVVDAIAAAFEQMGPGAA